MLNFFHKKPQINELTEITPKYNDPNVTDIEAKRICVIVTDGFF
jgi:hypothetical protein